MKLTWVYSASFSFSNKPDCCVITVSEAVRSGFLICHLINTRCFNFLSDARECIIPDFKIHEPTFIFTKLVILWSLYIVTSETSTSSKVFHLNGGWNQRHTKLSFIFKTGPRILCLIMESWIAINSCSTHWLFYTI